MNERNTDSAGVATAYILYTSWLAFVQYSLPLSQQCCIKEAHCTSVCPMETTCDDVERALCANAQGRYSTRTRALWRCVAVQYKHLMSDHCTVCMHCSSHSCSTVLYGDMDETCIAELARMDYRLQHTPLYSTVPLIGSGW